MLRRPFRRTFRLPGFETMTESTSLSTTSKVWTAIREALAGTAQDYTTGNLNRAIFLLAVPMVLEMAMESAFAVIDVFFVARLGANAVATVGLTESLVILVMSIAVGLSMAATAMVARRIGEKDPEGASVAAVQVIALGIAISAVLGLGGGLYARDLLRLMGAETGVLETGSSYTTIMLATNVVIMLLFLNNAIFRGAGDANIAMRALWLANGINIVLDPCLIFGLGPFPEMGVTGAAVATSIGRGTGVAYQFVKLGKGSSRMRVEARHLRLAPQVMWRLLRLSFGGVSQFLVSTASWIALVRIVAGFGSVALAGYTIGVRIIVFAILPSWGLCNAAATLVGQNLGAGKPERAESSVWRTGMFNMVFLCLVAVTFVGLAPVLIGLFTSDSAVAAIGVDCLRIISFGYPFYAWEMVMVQAFNGAGDTMTPTWINLLCFWLCQIPLAWFLAYHQEMGPNGVYTAVAICYSLAALVALVWFRRGRWKTRQV